MKFTKSIPPSLWRNVINIGDLGLIDVDFPKFLFFDELSKDYEMRTECLAESFIAWIRRRRGESPPIIGKAVLLDLNESITVCS